MTWSSLHLSRLVSIPIGFSNELQPWRHSSAARGCQVSIPIGFSNELQRDQDGGGPMTIPGFQSLSGFPMSCNVDPPRPRRPADPGFQSLSGFPMSCNGMPRRTGPPSSWFQSLSGFPMSCNGGNSPRSHRGFQFQSLSGFPMSCNRPDGGRLPVLRAGFNPYRVFQ